MRAYLWIVAAVLPLAACAISARPESASTRLGLATRPADPESLEGWQAVADQHGAALARLALAAPRESRDERPSADVARPDAARPHREPRPTAPSAAPPPPPPTAACESVSTRKRTTGYYRRHAGSAGSAERPLTRCERACLHVGAICYASQRICRIADRLGDAAARGSCAGAQQRCLDARAVARRAGCGCG